MTAWKVTADPGRFDEAVNWFLQRTVLTAGQAAELDLDTRQRAFWIGGGLQLTQVQRVFDEIAKANETGEPFEDWRARVRRELRNDEHALTVFRNATQRSLNSGRYRQMKDPAVAKHRPYWMYDSILDGRTSAGCKERDGTVLLIEHDWWKQGNVPPRHHRCRAGIRSLRKTEAERRGITNVPPVGDENPGWGAAPDAQSVWKPDPKKHDPKLISELEQKKQKADKKPAPKPAKNKPEHDPKHWEKEYQHLGEAGAPAAYGRAMLERGLDRPPGDVIAELERLRAGRHPGYQGLGVDDALEALRKLPANRPLRETLTAARWREFLAYTEHTRSVDAASDFIAGVAGDALQEERVAEANAFYRFALSRTVERPVNLHIERRRDGRWDSYFSAKTDRADGSKGPVLRLADAADGPTVAHEIAHALEHFGPNIGAKSRAFLEARTRGEQRKLLRVSTGFDVYGDRTAREDKFFDPYVGAHYNHGATEVTSMGYQLLLERPGEFLRDSHRADDEEYLFFLLGQLAGQ